MSASCARSSARSRATTGICLSPSRSCVDRDAVHGRRPRSCATSRLVMPARLARSGSISQLARAKLSAPQSSRTRAAVGHRRGGSPSACSASRAARRCRRPQMRIETGMPTGLPVSSCAHVDARARRPRVDSACCSGATRCAVSCLSFDLDDDLRVVELLQLGRRPRTRSAARRRRRTWSATSSIARLAVCPCSLAVLVGHLRMTLSACARGRVASPRAARLPAARRRRTRGTSRSFGKNCGFRLRRDEAAASDEHDATRRAPASGARSPSRPTR